MRENAIQRVADHEGKWRVMHLVDHSLPHQSGYSIRGKTIFENQRRAGLEPVVVTQHLTNSFHESVVTTTKYYYKRSNEIDYYFYRADAFRLHNLLKVLVRLGDCGLRGSYYAARSLDGICRRNYVHRLCEAIKPNVIHAHTGTGIYGRWLKSQSGVPWVYEMRGFWEDSFAAEGRVEFRR